ncbi:MAG: DRTGG domain-containing protein [Bacteroidales bacterium]|nr:DRTGG domain-containing protein [Bacteroidales bacterium]MDD3891663.1 DRTGG domain-containing protein [Bacteroidales bacterium]
MKVNEIAKILDAKILCGKDNLDLEFECAFASDLMSDVLTTEADGMLLLTGLANVQTIRTAEMSDIQGVVIVRNKTVSQEMIDLACENDIVLFECKVSMFKASGLLYQKGLKPLF